VQPSKSKCNVATEKLNDLPAPELETEFRFSLAYHLPMVKHLSYILKKSGLYKVVNEYTLSC